MEIDVVYEQFGRMWTRSNDDVGALQQPLERMVSHLGLVEKVGDLVQTVQYKEYSVAALLDEFPQLSLEAVSIF